MKVDSISLLNFRNFSSFFCEFHPDTNLIYGENAQGKTNLLESLVFLSQGKSFRGGKEKELLLFSKDFGEVSGKILNESREYLLTSQISLNKKKKMTKNGVSCRKNSEFSEVFQTVLFCPEDLSLVKAGALERRQFLDVAICQLRPQYAVALAEYKRLYQHKSRILKEKTLNLLDTLPEFNCRLAQTGTMLIHYRAHFIKRLEETLPPIHLELSSGKEKAKLAYETISSISDPLAGERGIFAGVIAQQERLFHREIEAGRCLAGPQRDDLLLYINDKKAKDYASQGQCRSFAIALKLAEREIFFQETGEYPVLLLDDVLSELDFSRQEYILNRIRYGQTFLTCCHKEGFHGLKEGGLFGIYEGQLCNS